jgi:hypothetical protein
LTEVRVPDPEDPSTRRDIEDIAPEEVDLRERIVDPLRRCTYVRRVCPYRRD